MTTTTATRKYIDCAEVPSERACALYISGPENDVLDAAVAHAISAHGHQDTPELRESIRAALKNEAA